MTIEVTITEEAEKKIREEFLRVCNLKDTGEYKVWVDYQVGLIFKSKQTFARVNPDAKPYFEEVYFDNLQCIVRPTLFFSSLSDLHLHCFAGREVVLTGRKEYLYEKIING